MYAKYEEKLNFLYQDLWLRDSFRQSNFFDRDKIKGILAIPFFCFKRNTHCFLHPLISLNMHISLSSMLYKHVNREKDSFFFHICSAIPDFMTSPQALAFLQTSSINLKNQFVSSKYAI